jgi:hypothetical protein
MRYMPHYRLLVDERNDLEGDNLGKLPLPNAERGYVLQGMILAWEEAAIVSAFQWPLAKVLTMDSSVRLICRNRNTTAFARSEVGTLIRTPQIIGHDRAQYPPTPVER